MGCTPLQLTAVIKVRRLDYTSYDLIVTVAQRAKKAYSALQHCILNAGVHRASFSKNSETGYKKHANELPQPCFLYFSWKLCTGKGHDLLAFNTKHPGRGRLVLQDLPPVINATGSVDPGIEKMRYDFFTEQPVKGARAYLYHHILHDWSDDKCLEILRKVKQAMKPGYSKLLICEMIMLEKRASTFYAILDMTMMAFNGGMERAESQWEDLMTRAGLEVTKIWHSPQEGVDDIVEVMAEG
ncbi:S-adenosyl-L-methionine-dependent methyltransferase [Nemania abortiva]|nr:S-adenosyl-L-methionine-dependent methyltransferase [Nemania abortiva]